MESKERREKENSKLRWIETSSAGFLDAPKAMALTILSISMSKSSILSFGNNQSTPTSMTSKNKSTWTKKMSLVFI